MDERSTVQALLASAGLHPPEEDMDALVKAHAQLRKMAELVFTVDESRYESPALSFAPIPAPTGRSVASGRLLRGAANLMPSNRSADSRSADSRSAGRGGAARVASRCPPRPGTRPGGRC